MSIRLLIHSYLIFIMLKYAIAHLQQVKTVLTLIWIGLDVPLTRAWPGGGAFDAPPPPEYSR